MTTTIEEPEHQDYATKNLAQLVARTWSRASYITQEQAEQDFERALAEEGWHSYSPELVKIIEEYIEWIEEKDHYYPLTNAVAFHREHLNRIAQHHRTQKVKRKR